MEVVQNDTTYIINPDLVILPVRIDNVKIK